MNPKEQYAEKLKDPRWQKKRLLVLERSGWRCSSCDREDRTLHVHHLKYVGANPWDTPDEFLECLCEVCHERREEANRMIPEMLREVSTKQLDQWATNVTSFLHIYETAPPDVQKMGAATFILKLMNLAVDQMRKSWREEKAKEQGLPRSL